MTRTPWLVACRGVIAALLLGAAPWAAGPAAEDPPRPRPRIVAVGDIHGDVEAFRAILQRAGLVDEAGRWSGGTAILVQTGDFTDRGAHVREVIDLMLALEPQARAAGGRIEVLLGNHEALNLIGELRDVNPEVYARFAGPGSEQRRLAAFDAHAALARARAAEVAAAGDRQLPVPGVYAPVDREAWLAARPPGLIEYVEAFGPEGTYGRWLRARPAALAIEGTVFVHGGFNPEVAPKRLDDVSEQVQREVRRFDEARAELVSRKAALPFYQFQEVLEASRFTVQVALANAATGDAVTVPGRLRPLDELGRIGTWWLINPNGPLWFRGFATWTTTDGSPRIDDLAKRYRAERFVVGHTMPASMRITPRFARRVFLIDTGMLSSHYKGGRPSALEIDGDAVTAIYLEGRQPLAGPGAPLQPAGPSQ
jgi:hypothetical protein